jgi:uncharacterized alkaline shock family protein YloU
MREEQKVDLGSIQIHKKVIADIAVSALKDVEGVTLAENDVLSRLYALVGYQDRPGVTVRVDSDNQVSIEVRVIVRYGANVPDVAGRIQDIIRRAVEKTADIDLKDVNVNIQGIRRGDDL